MLGHPGIAARPGYYLSKTAGSVLFQALAENIPSEEIQIVNFHPGAIYSEAWEAMGLPPDLFDNGEISFLLTYRVTLQYLMHADNVYSPWHRSALR